MSIAYYTNNSAYGATSSDTNINVWGNVSLDANKQSPEFGCKKVGEEIKDPALNIIASGSYLNTTHVVWLLDRSSKSYDNETINILKKYYGLKPFICDPVNDKHSAPIPNINNWKECLITDCLESNSDYIVRANIIKFALSCLKGDRLNRLTVIMRKSCDMDKEELTKLLYFARVNSVWEPNQFKHIDDRICLAAN